MKAPSADAKMLPDFELGTLFGADPTAVLRDEKDEVGAFMLALAAAFNDLKGADYLQFQLGKRQAAADSWPLAESGQYAGMRDQAVRLLMGIIHEILVLLKERATVTDSDEVRALVERLPDGVGASWRALMTVAQSNDRLPNRSDATSIILIKIRNNLAFHYAPQALAKGYLAHFAHDSAELHRSHAVMAFGHSMEQTRFYYADAAAVKGTSTLTGLARGDVLAQVFEVAKQINEALRWMVTLFVRERTGGLKPYPPPAG